MRPSNFLHKLLLNNCKSTRVSQIIPPPLPSNQTRFHTEQSSFVYSYSTNTLCLFPKYFIKQRQYLVGMFHPRCYARRPVSPFLTGLHLIDNFPLRSLARLPQLSIVLDNVDGSLTTVVVCFDKFIHTNVIPKSVESVLSHQYK